MGEVIAQDYGGVFGLERAGRVFRGEAGQVGRLRGGARVCVYCSGVQRAPCFLSARTLTCALSRYLGSLAPQLLCNLFLCFV